MIKRMKALGEAKRRRMGREGEVSQCEQSLAYGVNGDVSAFTNTPSVGTCEASTCFTRHGSEECPDALSRSQCLQNPTYSQTHKITKRAMRLQKQVPGRQSMLTCVKQHSKEVDCSKKTTKFDGMLNVRNPSLTGF